MSLRCLWISAVLAAVGLCAPGRTPTQDSLVYGEAAGEKLTMDYYAPSGSAVHPVVIIIHGGGFIGGTSKNGSEAYCADFLAPAGYAVFSINYRLAPQFPYPAMIRDVERAIRYIRHHASKWNADPNRIALVGGSAGGYLSNIVGLLGAPGDKSDADPVNRESARVEAVVTLFGPSDFRGHPMNKNVHALLDALVRDKGEDVALAEASPITYVTKAAPPFLFIHGDKDESVAFSESTNLQQALQRAGVRADLIRIPNGPHATGSWHKVPGVPDWERQTAEWLNEVLHHQGPVGEGIQARVQKSAPVNHDLGFDDTPLLPGLPYHVHDYKRPHPRVVTPAPEPGGAPSDAIVLFDGKDLSKWTGHHSSITRAGGAGDAEWKVQDGYAEVVPNTGDIASKDKFGDCQVHVEWSSPSAIEGNSQARGNSGVLLMGRYEVQVLDAYNNPTYADGQAGALYGQWPPLVNPARKPGEWQAYDIVFEAPRFEGTKLVKPAYFTVIWNGVLVHNHQASMGPMVYRQVAHYEAQPAEDSLVLQNHNDKVRYRNIWVRRLGGYDEPEK